jgi:DNA-binding protein HU-beta
MNKKELVEQLAKRTGFTKKDARMALDSLVDVITNALANNEEVTITGFGKFAPRPRRSSRRINPQTRARITVPSKVVPGFKPGKHLREKVMKNLRVVEVGGKLQVRK